MSQEDCESRGLRVKGDGSDRFIACNEKVRTVPHNVCGAVPHNLSGEIMSQCYFTIRVKKLSGICWTLEMARAIAKAEIKQLRRLIMELDAEPVISI